MTERTSLETAPTAEQRSLIGRVLRFFLENRLIAALMALSIAAGANCMITDPAKLALAIRAAELLLGRDDYAARYIGAFRRLTKLNG